MKILRKMDKKEREGKKKLKCPICGYVLERIEGCALCPHYGNCLLVKCPRCAYEFFPLGRTRG